MMGSFITRVLIMMLGYAYPAYECYKTVEKNKPGIEQLRFWCQYWILVAVLTVSERFGDAFISWLPMYSEAKLAFFVYLWCPKTRGTTYVYETFFRPYVAKHEVEIDRNLLELRVRAGDAVVLYWQKAASYGQTRFFEMLHLAASPSQSSKSRNAPAQKQDNPRSIPALVTASPVKSQSRNASALPVESSSSAPSQQPSTQHPPSPGKNQTAAPPVQQQTSHPSRVPSKSQVHGVSTEATSNAIKSQQCSPAVEAPSSPSKVQSRSVPAEAAPAPAKSQSRSTSSFMPSSASSSSSKTSEDKSKLPNVLSSTASTEDSKNPSEENIMEEAIRVTRGRLRSTRSSAAPTSTSPSRRQ